MDLMLEYSTCYQIAFLFLLNRLFLNSSDLFKRSELCQAQYKMLAVLLQKLEELTLYTIEQQKLIEKLLLQNQELAKQIDELR
jgi:hypothetical protein